MKNAFFLITLFGLVFAENVIEKDFVCPCKVPYRFVFFFVYLLLPCAMAYTITFCFMCEVEKQTVAVNAKCCNIFWQPFIPCIFWVLLFFSDGRYVACLVTDSKDSNLDSTSQFPWEWCDSKSTLTSKQKRGELEYIYSKVRDLSLLNRGLQSTHIHVPQIFRLLETVWDQKCRKSCRLLKMQDTFR